LGASSWESQEEVREFSDMQGSESNFFENPKEKTGGHGEQWSTEAQQPLKHAILAAPVFMGFLGMFVGFVANAKLCLVAYSVTSLFFSLVLITSLVQ
jgi:hypothetical protein